MTREVIQRVIEIADPRGAKITVVGVARIYGTSLGLPHPGLQPNRVELDELRTIIDEGARRLRRPGFEIQVAMSKSRNAPKMIARWGVAKRFHAIVVPDPERPRWRRMVEGDMAHEIYRRCGIPVHAVPVPSPGRARSA